MSTKAALKAAKTALDAGDYDGAVRNAQSALNTDPQNYFARLFLGRAYEKLSNDEESAKNYLSAAKLKPDDAQAWQGLCSLYESQGSANLDNYLDAATRLAEVFAKSDDAHRCQTTVDKLVAFSKQHGTQLQYKKALETLLPDSTIYDFLEGRIQHPSTTFQRLAEITEEQEAQTIKREIQNRRTRIGARLGEVTTEVKREVYQRSDLETIYQEIINWSADDELRRQYEQKALERSYEVLLVTPSEHKATQLDRVLTLAEGMVIIHHPFKMAWDLVLETRDLDDLRELDANILREYITLFPEAGLGKILKAWIGSEIAPFPPLKGEDGDEVEQSLLPEDRLVLMTDGLTNTEQSPFAHRLVSDYFLHLEEQESAMDTSKAGLKAVELESARFGMSLQNTKDALNSVLATSLIQYQAPRNHPEARRRFEDILQRKPKWTAALIGLGLILEENENYKDAISFLSSALQQDRDNVQVATELAWCRALGGDYLGAKHELEECLPAIKVDSHHARDLRGQVLYRIGVCSWNIDTTKSARKSRNGAYDSFLAAIKTNVNCAPAYTSLGFYYADYAKDRKRARQCFQKAFELSPAETDAAERLARSFADQADWDIVEVIAQRVIDSGRARPPPGSKRKGLSWPYSAIGVVQMNRQEYQKAITSFLAALRISPDDYQSYVGLGESYHNSGRYNSALRTLTYVLEPHDGVKMKTQGETWFAKYMLANVHRELGDYDEAIAELKEVLAERTAEFGVHMALLQTYVEKSTRAAEKGLFGQAVESAGLAIATATDVVNDRPDAFNMWKAVGDACLLRSLIQSGMPKFPADQVYRLLAAQSEESTFKILSEVDQVHLEGMEARLEDDSESTMTAILAGILSHKRAIHSSSHDIHAQAVAWYNLGWAEHRAFSCVRAKAGRKYLKAAVRCFKRAIELEAGNAEFWNALGVVTATLNPKVAQHSFVRSLHLNEFNAKVWTNLGALYLLQDDKELAHQAFGRAQSTDPDYAHAWVGEGLIALQLGDTKEALSHFTHAFEVTDSTSIITKMLYATSAFDHLLAAHTTSSDLTALIQPIFALEQLQRQVADDLPLHHLFALFLERVGDHAAAIDSLIAICSNVEAEYEATESLSALAHFARAKADLARNQLAVHTFSTAAENAETALDLSSDVENSGLDNQARNDLRLSAHLTAGLALHKLGQTSEAISMFKSALLESDNDPDVVCSLVRVLWAQGGEDERAVAWEQLLACVEQWPEHVSCVTLMGAIAAFDDDDDTAATVRDDLASLRTKPGLSTGERIGVSTLLSALAAMDPKNGDEISGALSDAQTSILLSPSEPQPWRSFAHLSDDSYAATMALKTAQKSVPPLGTMETTQLAETFAGVGTAGDAQRAIFLAPWKGVGWKTLRDAVSGPGGDKRMG